LPSLPRTAPAYTCGYIDRLDCCGENGCVAVPSGPDLGVVHDWSYIRKHAVSSKTFP
jgi:hypothetical protein